MYTNCFINVIDPKESSCYLARLKQTKEGFSLERSLGEPGQASNVYLSPGWIDLHTHILDGFTEIGVPPDDIGINNGVHILADAGSSGSATFLGLKEYIIPTAKTSIKAWLNISSIGLVHLREGSDLKYINAQDTLKVVKENPDLICGIKIRSSGDIVGNMGVQPLKMAKLVARNLNLPLMVHIGEGPPLIEDILNLLDRGDIITHCYHGKLNNPWNEYGFPNHSLKMALKRGVLLDIGHGAASFSLEVCRKAISTGFKPTTISTDLHVRNINGPVFDLATTMTKVMSCGLTLEEVVRGVTTGPSEILKIKDWGDLSGEISNATIFKLEDPNDNDVYKDIYGKSTFPTKKIVPISIISKGEIKKIQ